MKLGPAFLRMRAAYLRAFACQSGDESLARAVLAIAAQYEEQALQAEAPEMER